MRAAIYSRFSTDRQNESSIADQVRVCSEYAAREGMEVTTHFEDQGISGAALGNRPGATAMMEAALTRSFDVLLVMDLSRLSRSQADLPKMIDRLVAKGVRIVGVQDGYDSGRKGHKLQAGLSGIIGEAFRDMVKERTYAALESRAKGKRATGGKSYGYDCVGAADSRHLVIDPEEADVVRQIFLRYAAGESSRAIASDLNAKCIPAPGATWKRTTRRKDGKWLSSGVYALLKNEIYRGQRIWNRSQWRKDPDTGVRRRVERPRSEWIVRTEPTLRIVPEDLWSKVQARIHARTVTFASTGISRRGAQPRHLLSGLLTCGVCGSKYIVSGTRPARYVCSSRRNGGAHACSNALSAHKEHAEDSLLDVIKQQLLSPEARKLFVTEYTKGCREQDREASQPAEKQSAKVAKLDRQVEELETMLRDGRLSPAIAGAALEQARSERQAMLEVETRSEERAQTKVMRLYPKAADAFLAQIEKLRESLEDPEIIQRARPLVHGFFGGSVRVRPDGEQLIAEVELSAIPLLKAAGARINDFQNGSGGRI